VMYVGTKKQAQEAIAEQARRVGMPYVNQRWLGGMLTNFSTVYKRLQRLKELEEIDFDNVAASGMTKKELLQLRREHDKLDKTLGGIRDMSRVPSALWVVDTKKEHIAVNEARKLGIPVVAILDTNCDPDEVNYPIPGNDDAIRSVALLTRVVADAVAEGLIARAGASTSDEKPAGGQPGAEEPLAEWERELLEGAADTTEAAAGSGTAGTGTAVAGTADTTGTVADTTGTVADTANDTTGDTVNDTTGDTVNDATGDSTENTVDSTEVASAEDPASAAADIANADAEAKAALDADNAAAAIEAADDAAGE
jgi:small subunit ribosomal protein S2